MSVAAQPTFQGEDLRGVLEAARAWVMERGILRRSARGRTVSVPGVKLVWERPAATDDAFWGWDRAATARYLERFVDARPENRPERLADPGELLFAYTYAARSRFWDGGWGYVLAVLRATQELGAASDEILATPERFRAYLEATGERVHLQTILAVWDWLGPAAIQAFLQDSSWIKTLAERSRLDQLERVIAESAAVPASRRAVTASFVYPCLDQRSGLLGSVPPYQLFQLLPAAAREPLDSFHYHRSLDASDGVQLDFHHDLHWLELAGQATGRPLGSITVVAGDFHVYLPEDADPAVQPGAEQLSSGSEDGPEAIERWLLRVTDGYLAGQCQASALLQRQPYRQNFEKIYRQIGGLG
jgi:hypothetical protein